MHLKLLWSSKYTNFHVLYCIMNVIYVIYDKLAHDNDTVKIYCDYGIAICKFLEILYSNVQIHPYDMATYSMKLQCITPDVNLVLSTQIFDAETYRMYDLTTNMPIFIEKLSHRKVYEALCNKISLILMKHSAKESAKYPPPFIPVNDYCGIYPTTYESPTKVHDEPNDYYNIYPTTYKPPTKEATNNNIINNKSSCENVLSNFPPKMCNTCSLITNNNPSCEKLIVKMNDTPKLKTEHTIVTDKKIIPTKVYDEPNVIVQNDIIDEELLSKVIPTKVYDGQDVIVQNDIINEEILSKAIPTKVCETDKDLLDEKIKKIDNMVTLSQFDLEKRKSEYETEREALSKEYSRINKEKLELERIVNKKNEKKRMFNEGKNIYGKLKREIACEERKENDIPELFKNKYNIYKEMDESGQLHANDEYETYLEYETKLKLKQYENDKCTYYDTVKKLENDETSLDALDIEYRCKHDIFEILKSTNVLDACSLEEEYKLFLETYADYLCSMQVPKYVPEDIHYLQDADMGSAIKIINNEVPKKKKEYETIVKINEVCETNMESGVKKLMSEKDNPFSAFDPQQKSDSMFHLLQ